MKSLKFVHYLLVLAFLGCQEPFDKEIWQKNENNDLITKNNPRSQMINDLIENHLEIGQTKEYISNLLGQPIHIDKNNHQFKYLLGPTTGDFEFLILTFSQDGKLIDYEIKQT